MNCGIQVNMGFKQKIKEYLWQDLSSKNKWDRTEEKIS